MTGPIDDAMARRIYYDVPAVVLVYGYQNTGKTTDILRAGANGIIFGQAGNLKPSISVLGWTPRAVEDKCKTIADVTKVLKDRIQGKSHGFDLIGIDEASVLAAATKGNMERSNTGWKLWTAIKKELEDLLVVARDAHCHVILNAHPRLKDDDLPVGGPDMPMRELTCYLPSRCDIALRTDVSSLRSPWPIIYVYDPTALDQWFTKDRHNVCWKETPQNLRVILAEAGYGWTKRPNGLEWMDEMMNMGVGLAEKQSMPLAEIMQKAYLSSLKKPYSSPNVAACVAQDIRDLYEIRVFNRERQGIAYGGGIATSIY